MRAPLLIVALCSVASAQPAPSRSAEDSYQAFLEQRAQERAAVKARVEQQAQERAAHTLKMKRAAADPGIAQIILSRWLCAAQDDLAEAQEDLAEDKRAAAESGVIDLRARHEAGQVIAAAKANIRRYRARLKALKVAPLSCAAIEQEFDCAAPECAEKRQLFGEVEHHGEAVILGLEPPPPATVPAPPASPR